MIKKHQFEKIENFRDLGGYDAHYGHTQFGVIYTCNSLHEATSGDLDYLAALGIKTIVDLIDNDCVLAFNKLKNDPRFKTIECPLDYKDLVDKKDIIQSYFDFLMDPRQVRKVFLSIMNSPKPLLIHCGNKNRMDVFSVLLLLANGVSMEEVSEGGPSFLESPLSQNGNLLDFYKAFIQKWESVDDYFEWLFFTDDEIELLHNLLGKQEKSCGAVVFFGNEILVEHMAKGHYSIPKGHVEPSDKDEKATALREIKEETGLEATLMQSDTRSIYYSPEKGIAKEVQFFIADVNSKKTTPQKEEVSDIYWLSPNDAIRCMSHDSDKKIIQWACEERAKILYQYKKNQ